MTNMIPHQNINTAIILWIVMSQLIYLWSNIYIYIWTGIELLNIHHNDSRMMGGWGGAPLCGFLTTLSTRVTFDLRLPAGHNKSAGFLAQISCEVAIHFIPNLACVIVWHLKAQRIGYIIIQSAFSPFWHNFWRNIGTLGLNFLLDP